MMAEDLAVEQHATSSRGSRTRGRLGLPFYLAGKEIWRTRGRFFLVSIVIALITILVLFIAALAEGLGAGNREYLAKLDADLLVYQANADLTIPFSRLGGATIEALAEVEGVRAVGPIAFSNATVSFADDAEPLKVALIGVVPGLPGVPPALTGRTFSGEDVAEAIIDRNVARRTGLEAGDTLMLKTTQDTEEIVHRLTIAGVSDGRQYGIQPAVFVPFRAWDQIRPRDQAPDADAPVIFNVAAVQLDEPAERELMAPRLASEVERVEAVDLTTAYEATPGYAAQQSTLDTQRYFSLLIGILVIGGFFQIQTLQKVAQIGMLKAIGASNFTIGVSFILQIIAVTGFGVLLGAVGTALLALALPAVVPLEFTFRSTVVAIISLLVIGPLGGIVSVRYLLRIEPLRALGLAS
jgi:putative ABC transport system permease protein